jgi:FPC/CPF motif-containing protein YcgG
MLKKAFFLAFSLALFVLVSLDNQAFAQFDVTFDNPEKVATYGEPVDKWGYLISLEDYADNEYKTNFLIHYLQTNNPAVEFRFQPQAHLLKAIAPRQNYYNLTGMRAQVAAALAALNQILSNASNDQEANIALKQALQD